MAATGFGFELGSDLRYGLLFVHFKAGTCQLVLIAWPNGFVTIHVKIDGPVSNEKLDY